MDSSKEKPDPVRLEAGEVGEGADAGAERVKGQLQGLVRAPTTSTGSAWEEGEQKSAVLQKKYFL